jgi:hypothetical protein
MNFLPASVVLALLAFPLQGQKPDGAPPPPTGEKPKPLALQQLFGAWRLTDFETPVLRPDFRDEVGYLLIGDGFASFECHIGWLTDTGKYESGTYFSGTHTFTMRSDDVLELSSLIGTIVDPRSSNPIALPVGTRRQYKARIVGAKLVLVREQDQQTFTFERLASSASGLDFYGRRRKPDVPPPAGDK